MLDAHAKSSTSLSPGQCTHAVLQPAKHGVQLLLCRLEVERLLITAREGAEAPASPIFYPPALDIPRALSRAALGQQTLLPAVPEAQW
jgi:hypothetical protein